MFRQKRLPSSVSQNTKRIYNTIEIANVKNSNNGKNCVKMWKSKR